MVDRETTVPCSFKHDSSRNECGKFFFSQKLGTEDSAGRVKQM